jgi:formate dehydrogenase maturation protein FdhE
MSKLYNKAREYVGVESIHKISLDLMEYQVRGERKKVLAMQSARTALETFGASIRRLQAEVVPSPGKPINSDSKEAIEADKEVERALQELLESIESARNTVNEGAE